MVTFVLDLLEEGGAGVVRMFWIGCSGRQLEGGGADVVGMF